MFPYFRFHPIKWDGFIKKKELILQMTQNIDNESFLAKKIKNPDINS